MAPITGPEIQAKLGVELVWFMSTVVVGSGAVTEFAVIELVGVEGEFEVDGGLEVGLMDEARDDGQ
jgi:hypothetical protein